MDISVVICTYNRAKLLEKLFSSFVRVKSPQGFLWEILVIDNGSKDDTKDIVKRWIEDGKISIAYFFLPRANKSAALNFAIEKSKGKTIAFTDDDVVVDINWLEAILKALDKYPHSAFGGRIIPRWDRKMPKWLSDNGRYATLRGTVFMRDDGDKDQEYNDTMSSYIPCGANMFFRRTVIETNGPFRIDLGPSKGFPGTSEDTEFCSRMLKNGEKFMYIADAVVYHPAESERISKKALLNWRYYCARSEVRACSPENRPKYIFKVPRYLIRQLISNARIWISSFDAQKRFYYKLKTYYTFGEISEHISQPRNRQTGN